MDGRPVVVNPLDLCTPADFPVADLVASKRGRVVSVCMPARDEASTIGPIVSSIRAELVDRVGLVDEVLVVDDGSRDDTAPIASAAGARVISSVSVLPEHSSGYGKGQAMWKAVHACRGDLIVFCDADVTDFDPRFVSGLLGPLLTCDDIALVKATYLRPLNGEPTGGGRVTELMAKPLLATLFPPLTHVRQPLAGESAAPRRVLEAVPFCDGYGIELGLLLDVAATFGPESIAQVDLGTRSHRNRSLEELSVQSLAILRVALRKAEMVAADPASVSSEGERPPLVELASYRERGGRSSSAAATASSTQPTGSAMARGRP